MSGPDRTADLAGFLDLLREELGLDVTVQQAAEDFDTLPAWDSVHLLRLVMLLEQDTGRRIPVAAVLRSRTLAQIHALAHGERTPA